MKAAPMLLISLLVGGCYRHARPDAPSAAPSAIKTELASVPSVSFTQGDNTGEPDEYPERQVRIDAFKIERTEVSNRAYQACVEAKACVATPYADDDILGESTHPVVGITWEDAVRYCKWIGRRLPTEAEWEHAARGPDLRRYPWSGGFEPKRANTSDPADGFPKTAPVDAFGEGASPYGLLNVAGNVGEWVADYYDPTEYRTNNGNVTNPTGPSSGRERVVRGGGYSDPNYLIRVTARRGKLPTESDSAVGFRCAADD